MNKKYFDFKILPALAILVMISGTLLTAFSLTACGATEPETEKADTSQILITAPKGGETFKVGETIYVKWKLQGMGVTDISSVVVNFSPDNGKQWFLVVSKSIGPGEPGWGNFPFVIPDSLPTLSAGKINLVNTKECRFQVKDYNTSIMNITKAFTITQ